MGFGLCLLLASFGAYAVLDQYYGQVMEWRGTVEQIYELTHSPAYEGSMRALEELSPYANRLADLLRRYGWILGIGWLSEYVSQIGSAASYMRRVYEASKAAYRAVRAVEVAPQLLEYGIAAGPNSGWRGPYRKGEAAKQGKDAAVKQPYLMYGLSRASSCPTAQYAV